MTVSRREVIMMLPAVAAAGTAQGTRPEQQRGAQTAPQPALLPAKVYHSTQVPYTGDGKKKGRRFFYGTEHSGFNIECHETVLGPGVETHPPHTHEHEEIIILVEGTIEVSMDGKSETVGAGSVLHYEPSRPHNLRNVGATPCRYYVIELRGKNP